MRGFVDEPKDNPGGLLSSILHPSTLWNALKVSLVVGTILNLINQGQRIRAGQGLLLGHALLNFVVPFLVSAYSGAKARSGKQASNASDAAGKKTL